jgi:hypothetical protein
MDKEVGLLEGREAENKATATSSSTPSMHHVHAQASLKMDMFLSRGRQRPDVSLFVNLLYLATVLTLATSLICFALRVFVGTSKADGMCFTDSYERHGRGADSTTPSIDGVPDELQEWVKNAEGYWGGDALTYAHMVDGATYFVVRNASSTLVAHNYFDDDSTMHENIRTLLATGPDGSIRSISDVFNPRWSTTVAGESALASEAFCCLYTPSVVRRGYGRQATRADHNVLCVAASEDTSRGFRNVTLSWEDRRRNAQPLTTKAYSGELWILVRVWEERHMGGNRNLILPMHHRYHRDSSESIEIYKLHPRTMQVTSIANITLNNGNENPFRFGDSYTCFRWATAIGSVVGAAVLAPASIWMLKVRKMPAGVVPVCIGLIALIGLLSEDLAYGIAFLTVVALTIFLLGTPSPWMRRDVVLWALYSILAVLSAINLGEAEISIGAIILCVIVGLVLDHPVLQFVGWLSGIMTTFIGIFSFFSKRGDFENLIMIPIGIVVSCGLVSVGYTLTKYRAYLVYNTRRLWRLMSKSRGNTAGRQPHGDDMTRGLLD